MFTVRPVECFFSSFFLSWYRIGRSDGEHSTAAAKDGQKMVVFSLTSGADIGVSGSTAAAGTIRTAARVHDVLVDHEL